MAQSDGNGPYPAGAFPPPERGSRSKDANTMGGKLGPPRKMTLTEAWGTAEPEPFEEFSAGTGLHGRNSARSSLDQPAEGGFEAMHRRDARAPAARRGESLDITSPRRNKLPPPQPIFLPGTRTAGADVPPNDTQPPASQLAEGSKPQTVQRTRSLMQRIRKMRDNPNVPVGGAMAVPDAGYYSDMPYTPKTAPSAWTPGPRTQTVREEPEPTILQARPSHKRTHVRGTSGGQDQPKQAVASAPPSEPFVIVDSVATVAASLDKALPPPPPPPNGSNTEYFDRPVAAPQNGNGIGRKPSLYKKVKGAVVGGYTKKPPRPPLPSQ